MAIEVIVHPEELDLDGATVDGWRTFEIVGIDITPELCEYVETELESYIEACTVYAVGYEDNVITVAHAIVDNPNWYICVIDGVKAYVAQTNIKDSTQVLSRLSTWPTL